MWLHHVDAGVVVLSSGSGDDREERWRDGERARIIDDVVGLGNPKTIEGACVERRIELGADVVREMGISASRTGDGSRPPNGCNQVRLPSGGVGRDELLDEKAGVTGGECEFGLRGEGVREKEERSREPLGGVLVVLGGEGHGAAIIIPSEAGEDDERNG